MYDVKWESASLCFSIASFRARSRFSFLAFFFASLTAVRFCDSSFFLYTNFLMISSISGLFLDYLTSSQIYMIAFFNLTVSNRRLYSSR